MSLRRVSMYVAIAVLCSPVIVVLTQVGVAGGLFAAPSVSEVVTTQGSRLPLHDIGDTQTLIVPMRSSGEDPAHRVARIVRNLETLDDIVRDNILRTIPRVAGSPGYSHYALVHLRGLSHSEAQLVQSLAWLDAEIASPEDPVRVVDVEAGEIPGPVRVSYWLQNSQCELHCRRISHHVQTEHVWREVFCLICDQKERHRESCAEGCLSVGTLEVELKVVTVGQDVDLMLAIVVVGDDGWVRSPLFRVRRVSVENQDE